jgi:hypothetical protein
VNSAFYEFTNNRDTFPGRKWYGRRSVFGDLSASSALGPYWSFAQVPIELVKDLRLDKTAAWLAGFVLLVVGAGAGAGGEPAVPTAFNAAQVTWRHLSYQASNRLVAVTTNVDLTKGTAVEAQKDFVTSPRGTPFAAAGDEVFQVEVDTVINPTFSSRVELAARVWFSPEDATALQRFQTRSGEDDYLRWFRFTREGVYRLQKEPQDAKEAAKLPRQWTRSRERFYSYGTLSSNCAHISDVSVLVYMMSAAPISEHMQPMAVCLFGRRALHRLQIRVAGTEQVEFDYAEKDAAAAKRKKGSTQAFKIAVEPLSSKADNEMDEEFSFFGFTNDIVIYVDPATHIPLQISGAMPMAGRVNLPLREVSMLPAAQSRPDSSGAAN